MGWEVAASGIGRKWKRDMGDLISLRPITLPVLCPRFDQVRVFRMRARDVPGPLRMVLSGLVPCSVARSRRGPAKRGIGMDKILWKRVSIKKGGLA